MSTLRPAMMQKRKILSAQMPRNFPKMPTKTNMHDLCIRLE
jgi:hypothetical protein